MGLIKELLGQVSENQRYAKDRSYQDSSSRSSRKKKILYVASCQFCGQYCTGGFVSNSVGFINGKQIFGFETKAEAVAALQNNSNGCGKNSHFPIVEEMERK